MTKFKPGPWASSYDYFLMKEELNRWRECDKHKKTDNLSAFEAAVRCMELVPVLVEALSSAEWSGSKYYDAECCPYCRALSPRETITDKGETNGVHRNNCALSEALKMARGE